MSGQGASTIMPKKAHVIEDVSGNTAVDLKVRSRHDGMLQILGGLGSRGA